MLPQKSWVSTEHTHTTHTDITVLFIHFSFPSGCFTVQWFVSTENRIAGNVFDDFALFLFISYSLYSVCSTALSLSSFTSIVARARAIKWSYLNKISCGFCSGQVLYMCVTRCVCGFYSRFVVVVGVWFRCVADGLRPVAMRLPLRCVYCWVASHVITIETCNAIGAVDWWQSDMQCHVINVFACNLSCTTDAIGQHDDGGTR